ncbi:MAG: DUF4825 domain-containing protein [Clostridia bacterium]|nr:DUF4825 domain-containing protein [Clostridia bacterium]
MLFKNMFQYKSPKFWGLILATIAVIVIGIGLISNPINTDDLPEVTSTTDIWNARTPYVGDNSAVSNLLNLMPLPDGLEHDSIMLHTSGEERGLEWILVDSEDVGYDDTELQRTAILIFASIENLKDIYITTKNSYEQDTSLHYDFDWTEQILGADVKSYYGVSPEKLQDLIDLTASRIPLAKYSIAKMGPGGEVISEVVLRDPEFAKAILFDSMIKSARFEGTDIADLTDYYRVRVIYPEVDETHDYYAYKLDDGKPVLQSEPEGWYSIISGELYPQLVEFFR